MDRIKKYKAYIGYKIHEDAEGEVIVKNSFINSFNKFFLSSHFMLVNFIDPQWPSGDERENIPGIVEIIYHQGKADKYNQHNI